MLFAFLSSSKKANLWGRYESTLHASTDALGAMGRVGTGIGLEFIPFATPWSGLENGNIFKFLRAKFHEFSVPRFYIPDAVRSTT